MKRLPFSVPANVCLLNQSVNFWAQGTRPDGRPSILLPSPETEASSGTWFQHRAHFVCGGPPSQSAAHLSLKHRNDRLRPGRDRGLPHPRQGSAELMVNLDINDTDLLLLQPPHLSLVHNFQFTLVADTDAGCPRHIVSPHTSDEEPAEVVEFSGDADNAPLPYLL
jgi:hypothetical protein